LSALSKKIDEITANTGGEPDLYAYFRDLLSRSTFGIGLLPVQVVIDTSLTKSRQRPDLTLYRADGAKALKTPDHAVAVFEVKKSDNIVTSGKAVLKEKRGYVQSGTRWFFLADQTVVWRVDVADRAAFNRAIDTRGPLPASIVEAWSWSDLKDPHRFKACFGVVSVDSLQLARELLQFRAGMTPFATLDAGGEGRELFRPSRTSCRNRERPTSGRRICSSERWRQIMASQSTTGPTIVGRSNSHPCSARRQPLR